MRGSDARNGDKRFGSNRDQKLRQTERSEQMLLHVALIRSIAPFPGSWYVTQVLVRTSSMLTSGFRVWLPTMWGIDSPTRETGQ